MVSQFSTLPVIDISPFLHNSIENEGLRQETAKAIHSACRDYGFFYLNISSYVDPAEPEYLMDLGHRFFALPQAEKDKYHLYNEDGARGSMVTSQHPGTMSLTFWNISRVCQAQRKYH